MHVLFLHVLFLDAVVFVIEIICIETRIIIIVVVNISHSLHIFIS